MTDECYMLYCTVLYWYTVLVRNRNTQFDGNLKKIKSVCRIHLLIGSIA